MILVDASVWIDLLNDVNTPETRLLGRLTDEQAVAVGDLTVVEVLQGFRHERDFDLVRIQLARFPFVEICGLDIAVQASRNYRALRKLGVTPRGTIDTLIATRCIVDRHALLFSDRDFEPFVEHLGLVSAMA